ncbi:MAG: CotH kinase family protein [Planctomycetes bacterium]|nr:CotH kinase family protein [Planctomycetota bacterium]
MRQFSWLPLLLLFGTPVFCVGVQLFQAERLVRNYVSRARHDPALIASATRVFVHVNKTTLENLLYATPEHHDSALPTLRLVVGNNTFDAMQHALITGDPELGHDPGGTKPYFDAHLFDAKDTLKEVKICMRGQGSWHHTPQKPSLRIKIDKGDVDDGLRYLELSRPEDVLALKNWLPDRIGREELGLLSDQGQHVRLFVNGKYRGVYLQTMRPGESLALHNGRMPGAFFKGDFRDDLWTNLEAWKLEGENSPAARAHFERFLAALAEPPSPAAWARLDDLVDFEVLARWAALMIGTGSVHTDHEHNHLYFLCSNQGRLEAFPWDANSFGMHITPDVDVDMVLFPLMDRATRNPRWVHRRNQLLQGLLEGALKPEALERRIDAEVARLRPDLDADVNLNSIEFTHAGLLSYPWSVLDIDDKVAELKAYVGTRWRFLRAYLDDARVAVEPDPELPGTSRVTVFGTAGVRVEQASGLALRTDAWAGDPTLLLPGLSEELTEYNKFNFDRGFPGRYHFAQPTPLVYRVYAAPEALRFSNALTGAAVTPQAAPSGALATRSLRPGDFPAPPRDDLVLGPGVVELTKDLKTARGQRLRIRAGTRLRLHPGVGIYARGQTLVEGTPAAPVVLEPAQAAPWACFGVAGAETVGSRFEYMRVHGGSVGTDGSVRFKGMFSVYDCDDVVLRGCWFGANAVGDDTVNLGESVIRVEECQWNDSRSDALDLDMCRGTVRACRWIDSGNDGLDLMTCTLEVSECSFVGSGDKGVSVGEGTRLVLRDSVIERCWIGMELKDDCRALVYGTAFRGNRLALNAYQKKWLYPGGGRGALVGCTLERSEKVDVSLKRRTSLLLLNTQVGTADAGGRLRVIEALPPEWAQLEARVRE